MRIIFGLVNKLYVKMWRTELTLLILIFFILQFHQPMIQCVLINFIISHYSRNNVNLYAPNVPSLNTSYLTRREMRYNAYRQPFVVLRVFLNISNSPKIPPHGGKTNCLVLRDRNAYAFIWIKKSAMSIL